MNEIDQIKKLEIKDGDVVLIRFTKGTKDLKNKIATTGEKWKELTGLLDVNATALVYPWGFDIDIMTEKQKKNLIKILRESLKTCE